MELSDLWSAVFSGENHRPTFALLRFLLRKEYVALDDPGISSLSVFMRWFMWSTSRMFGYLAYTIARPGAGGRSASRSAETASAS
jgi:hypothetical protein